MNKFRQFVHDLGTFNLSTEALREKGLEYWRERVYTYTLATMAVLGLVALVPSIFLSFSSGFYVLGIFDILAYLYVLALLFLRRLSYRFRASQLIALGLLMGLIVFYFTGHKGVGMFWLFMVPPLASLLLGLRWGIIFLGLDAALILLTEYLVVIKSTTIPGLHEFTPQSWIVFSINFLVTNALVTLPLGALLQGLFASTEREKQTEQSRANTATQLSLVYDNVSDIIFFLEVETSDRFRFLSVNRAFFTATGLTEAQVVGKLVQDIIPAPVYALVLEKYREAIRGKKTVKWEETSVYPAGTKHGEVSVTPIFDAQGRCTYLTGAVHDVTERMQAERTVRESEELYRDLADNSQTLICTHDLDGKLLSANDAAIRLTGYSVTNLLKMNLADLIVPERRFLLRRYLRRIKTVGRAYGFMEIQTANGERRIWEYHNVLRTEGVAAPIVRGMAQDITERKRAEADLQLFRQLIDQSNDAIEVLDPETGHFLDVNTKACLDLGYTRAEYLSLSVFDIDPMVNQSVFAESKVKLKESGALLWEGLHQRKDGSTFPVEVSFRNVQLDREYLVSVARDITNRKRLEEARSKDEERYSKLFRNMLNGFAFCQMLFDENNQPIDFIYLEVNGAFEDLTGLKNVVGKKVSEVIPGIKESNPELFEIYGRVALTGTPEKLEVFVDPLKIWFLISVYCPERGFFIAVFDNISERKKIEKDLRDGEERYRSLYEKAQKRLSQTMALHDIDKAISSGLDLKFILDIVLDQAMNELQVDAADILLYDPDTQILEFFVGKGFRSSRGEHATVPMDKGFAGRAILERKRIDVSDLREEAKDFFSHADIAIEAFVDFHSVPLIAKGKVLGLMSVFKRTTFAAGPEWLDYLETLAGQAAIAIDNISLFEGLQSANDQLVLGYNATIEGWSRALDLRDEETEGHTQRVTSIALSLARRMGVKDEELVHMRRGSLLHDIGKMGVPDSILLKPGKLTDEEWVIMKKHTQYAYEMLAPVLYLRGALDIPYSHHEQWDGSGYPRGLKGEEIPKTARIFAVADVYDALTSDRPYRKAWTKKRALDYIRKQSGKHFDPKVVKAFFKLELT